MRAAMEERGYEEDAIIASIRAYASKNLGLQQRLRLDDNGEGHIAVRAFAEAVGPHLAFLPPVDGESLVSLRAQCRIAESLGSVDLGIATSLLATILALDPISVGGTESQRTEWRRRVEQGATMAYCATEPQSGSDVSRLATVATRTEDSRGKGYVIRGRKQWITNGGVADAFTVLARAPDGPSWFIVDGRPSGLSQGAAEDKHGIRLSNTAAVTFEDVYVPTQSLVGEREGQGLAQAESVFGFARLIVAAFAIGAGWSALELAIRYSQQRRVGGRRLCDLDGYSNKLIVPAAVALESARAYLEATVDRFAKEGRTSAFNAAAAGSKYLASEAANAAADSSMQALGASGYARHYGVEKIRRDVRIAKIYEGTSEVLEGIVGREAWRRFVLRSPAPPSVQTDGLPDPAFVARQVLTALTEEYQRMNLQRNEHYIMQLGALSARVEAAVSFVELGENLRSPLMPSTRGAAARIAGFEAALAAAETFARTVCTSSVDLPPARFELIKNAYANQRGRVDDYRAVMAGLIDRFIE